MLPEGPAKKVTIYLNEDTRASVEPLWVSILAFLKKKHVARATVSRAEAGFGAHEQVHMAYSEYASAHRPLRLEFIDTPECVERLMPELSPMVTDGLITVQDIMVVKSVRKDRVR